MTDNELTAFIASFSIVLTDEEERIAAEMSIFSDIARRLGVEPAGSLGIVALGFSGVSVRVTLCDFTSEAVISWAEVYEAIIG